MRVLDLFAGLGGWSEAFRDRGHEILTVDNDPEFGSGWTKDIFLITAKDFADWKPDIILASPPCETFSVMTIGRNWTTDHKPKTEKAKLALDLALHTVDLIKDIDPQFWVIENPRAKLRRFYEQIPGLEDRRTVAYCQLGEKFQKPTDLWGGFPPSLELPPMCKRGSPCHTPAKRGSKTGIQGDTRTKFRGGMIEDMIHLYSQDPRRKELSALRAKIPYKLSELVCLAAEQDLRV